jgi:hypothetical protein
MQRAPRYAPRSSFRTRPSAGEVPKLADDFAATALDRPIVSVDAFAPPPAPPRRPARATPRRARSPRSPLRWVLLVLLAGLAGGVGFGGVLALLSC